MVIAIINYFNSTGNKFLFQKILRSSKPALLPPVSALDFGVCNVAAKFINKTLMLLAATKFYVPEIPALTNK